jgi:hypothetical protein
MFELYQVGLAFVALLIGIFVWAGIVWSNRSKAQSINITSPEEIDFSTTGSSGFYVATTFADRPLDRVSAHGLGFGGKATVEVLIDGINISRTGEKSFRIAKSSLVDIARTSVVIDKAVEKDGLLSLRWRLGDALLESHFRFPSSSERDQVAVAVANLLVGAK